MHRRCFAAGLVVLAAAIDAQQAPPDYGFDFVTISDAGNPNADPASYFSPSSGRAAGGVDYDFRVTRSKVDAGAWLEFVDAYWPYRAIPGDDSGRQLLGLNTLVANPDAGPGEDPGAFLLFGQENWAANTTWQAAARFANWLHNDKVNEPWAFETGAYDFTQSSFPTRSDSARYWVPNMDESVKAIYWDPHRYGSGQGGYWRHPDSSDTPLIPGPPGTGETPALEPDNIVGTALQQYPAVQSPWGLLDVSGIDYELTADAESLTVFGIGSSNSFLYEFEDTLGAHFVFASGGDGTGAFRLASAIPAPGASITMVIALLYTKRRRFV